MKKEGRQGRWQEKVGARGVRVFMVFLWFGEFTLGSRFSSGSTSVSFLWIYGILIFSPLGLCYSLILLGLGIC